MTGDAGESKRAKKRDSLFLSATVRVSEATGIVMRVRNLSSGGMMIDASADLVPGTRVTAELRGIGTVQGRIAWASPGKAGVAFDQEIDPRLARAAGGTKMEIPDHLKALPPARRPGLAVR